MSGLNEEVWVYIGVNPSFLFEHTNYRLLNKVFIFLEIKQWKFPKVNTKMIIARERKIE